MNPEAIKSEIARIDTIMAKHQATMDNRRQAAQQDVSHHGDKLNIEPRLDDEHLSPDIVANMILLEAVRSMMCKMLMETRG